MRWLGAVQAQDYPAAKWGLGLRAPGVSDADVERAFDEGAILRTHVLRPTWHFVTPSDIRWMLALTASSSPGRERVLLPDARARRGDPETEPPGLGARASGREESHEGRARARPEARPNSDGRAETHAPDGGRRARRRSRERSAEGKAVHLCPPRRAGAKGSGSHPRGSARRAQPALLREPRAGHRPRLRVVVGSPGAGCEGGDRARGARSGRARRPNLLVPPGEAAAGATLPCPRTFSPTTTSTSLRTRIEVPSWATRVGTCSRTTSSLPAGSRGAGSEP